MTTAGAQCPPNSFPCCLPLPMARWKEALEFARDVGMKVNRNRCAVAGCCGCVRWLCLHVCCGWVRWLHTDHAMPLYSDGGMKVNTKRCAVCCVRWLCAVDARCGCARYPALTLSSGHAGRHMCVGKK